MQMDVHAYWSMGMVVWQASVLIPDNGGKLERVAVLAGHYEAPDAPTAEDELSYLTWQVSETLNAAATPRPSSYR